ncbi:ATP-binding cassette domain-containing protein [Evansella cellulosilytica]|uniref:ABC transporter related protein n=1 Tax=Evansella cellulosilytica (strain ATCC 21833 / DSM 2522 / FERM P-1141 / JCM 9156 / N-4) TaxID=649639 RepID=E6TUK1_EVAC2|nr:ABC transporter ATP-binding protein [Evansella cellulosilytica]ADU30891.1 ABC transporter related protein [Evansella cellulosilytica DSM 2522]
MAIIQLKEVTKQYRSKNALRGISFDIEENTITGLIGRNGAGKTTLLKIITGHIKATSGEAKVFGKQPFDQLTISANSIFVDDQMSFPESLTLYEILEKAESFYKNWDNELALRLFEYFSFHKKQYHSELSKGMKSTFHSIIGIASRCPLTIFDEPTTGMDSSVRKDFYRALLKDYIAHPRTIILSSHLLGEIEELLENILLLKEGEVVLHQSIDDMKELAIALRGNKNTIKQFIPSLDVYHEHRISEDFTYIVVENRFNKTELQKIKEANIEVNRVPTDDLCVFLTSKTKGGIDDVFQRS